MYMYDTDARNLLILAKFEGLLSVDHVFIGFDAANRGTLMTVKNIEPHITDNVVYEGVMSVTEDYSPDTAEWKQFQIEIALSLSTKNFSWEQIKTVLKEAEPYTGNRNMFY